MQTNVILCVLNNVFLNRGDDGRSLPDELAYTHVEHGGEFHGIQANEAPVKYLIKKAHDAKNPVKAIIYLCSEKCLQPTIPYPLIGNALPQAESCDYTPERFFNERIEKYCKENGYETPMPTPIAYNPAGPADSLDAFIEIFESNSRYSIDITGGQRDTVILLAIASQIIKMGATESAIGDIVYSNFGERAIYKQNNTFNLVDLLNAINVFTDYGRADKLESFFCSNEYTKESTRKLCRSIRAFSDSLALCQVNGIELKVREIQKCLDDVEIQLGRFKDRYSLYTDAIEQIGGSSEVRERTFEEALDEIAELNPNIDFTGLSKNELAMKLEDLRKPSRVNRGELLFLSLIPMIREKFIPETDDESAMLMNIIAWCADHQMIQQALGIYRERISECLVRLGFFNGSLDIEETQSKELTNLCSNCKPIKNRLSMYQDHDLFSINREKEPQMRLIYAWYTYLHETRNAVMHASSGKDKYNYFFACALLGKDPDSELAIEDLENDIKEALDSIVSPISITTSEWNEARSTARKETNRARSKGTYGKERRDYEKYAKATTEDKVSGGKAIETMEELTSLISEYSSGQNRVLWSTFETWCVEERRCRLDRSGLALPEEGSYPQSLCSKYPSRFSLESTAFGDVLSVKDR
ncbi:MAG: TM1812 family CRISPR-associated protein [Eggerthellaceae bacterium]|nr:TM1812 family CRISPR-associated protein [Eggerthellaceae bacterium]